MCVLAEVAQMLEMMARKSFHGDLYLSLAEQHLSRNEWGLARIALEQALRKGSLIRPDRAERLREEIGDRLGTALPADSAGACASLNSHAPAYSNQRRL